MEVEVSKEDGEVSVVLRFCNVSEYLDFLTFMYVAAKQYENVGGRFGQIAKNIENAVVEMVTGEKG